ncbi:MAG TPA: hypothetical protein VM577_11510 [Anaerovoracaceae bacterium]|nr:hypothetical protein [Anaerovoracaceae bacterium]
MDKVENNTLQPLFYDDDELTPITCIRCGANMLYGVGTEGTNCTACKRRSLTPSQHSVSKVRAARTSQQIRLYEQGAKEIAEKLEKMNTILTKKLAANLRTLEIEFCSWQEKPPVRERKDKYVEQLVNLTYQAYSILESKNAR